MQRKPSNRRMARGLSMVELLVVISIIAILASLLLLGVGRAKAKGQAARCQSNLRQIAIGLAMYMSESRSFPGGAFIGRDDGGDDYYVWPMRLLPYVGDRSVFHCPTAPRDSAWDTNVNRTLGATSLEGQFDPFGIRDRSRFSIGYNDWGIGQGQIAATNVAQLGLGGDVSGPFFKGPVIEPYIVDPSAMIAIGESKIDGSWDGSLDPTEEGQWPSNRHDKRTNLQFADGHSESALRREVIDPKPDSPWRRRWNIDNDPHSEITWSVNWAAEAPVEK